jgi:plasmid maintenance system antidote protein VapI
MTPIRLREILNAFRWSYTSAAEALGVTRHTIRRSATGAQRLPDGLADGLERLHTTLQEVRDSNPHGPISYAPDDDC